MEINDNLETVTCRLCGDQCKRIYGRHLKHSHNNMTTNEYKDLFPGAPIAALVDKNKTSISSGLHMKEEKYRTMFSDKIKGEKNPNHKSKTTELQRKSRSPFSKKFIKYEGVSDVEFVVSEFAKKAIENRIHPTSKEYYMNIGHSEEDSIKLLSKRQSTFSLDKCIEKHGEELGRKRWLERQEKWLNNYKRVNYSKISQEMFISLYEILLTEGFNKRVYFAKLDNDCNIHETNKNYEYRLRLNKSFILPDFFIPSLKLIIEFDGTYYHRNTPENSKREKERDENIINSGYEVLHISEKEYNSDKKLTISNLVEFIKRKQSKNV